MTAWLIDTLMATTALMLLVLLVREPVRNRFGATAAYALWLIPAARMAMPPLTQTVERIVPAAAPADAPLMLGQFAPAVPATDPSLIEQLGGWPTLLIALWATGTLLFLALGLIRYRRQRDLVLDDAVQLARLGSIRLVRSHAVRGPIAFGILDRVIAVPHDFDQRFDEAQRRLALDHELSHHRSGDLIVNHLAFVLLGLQWFNPLAWIAHAAFRFDQEAACDARVLATAGPSDRAAYGHTIAKAASGRALLFASALDHHHNLHRRLKSMLTNPTPSRRLAGKLAVVAALAVALPLTATWATRYVDADAPEAPTPPTPPSPATAPEAPLAPLPPLPAAAPLAPEAPLPPVAPRGKVMIDGKQVAWNSMTLEEKARIRASLADARRELATNRADRLTAIADMKAASRDHETARRDHETARRDIETARRDVEAAMREIDRNADEIRKAGQDPEAIKATVRASLKAVEAIDIDAITRRAMASVDPALIERSIAAAEEGLRRAQAEIDAADRGN
ncbi:MAG: M56 family metallopeptidase [Sphingomicrobium sp.]